MKTRLKQVNTGRRPQNFNHRVECHSWMRLKLFSSEWIVYIGDIIAPCFLTLAVASPKVAKASAIRAAIAGIIALTFANGNIVEWAVRTSMKAVFLHLKTVVSNKLRTKTLKMDTSNFIQNKREMLEKFQII
jgi:hypothetical protein